MYICDYNRCISFIGLFITAAVMCVHAGHRGFNFPSAREIAAIKFSRNGPERVVPAAPVVGVP